MATAPTFSLGTAPPTPPSCKKKKLSTNFAKPTFSGCFGPRPAYFLPTEKLPLGLTPVLYEIPKELAAQETWMKDYIRRVAAEKQAKKPSFTFECKRTGIPETYVTSLPPITLVKSHLDCLRKATWAFKCLLHAFRVKHLKAVNTEDIVTMEVPLKPVSIVDWAQKTTTVFEATTLMKDITTCLLHHDGFFEEPKAPRNPLTNLPLTLSQLLSVWTQITKAGVPASSVFAEYRSARYCLTQFHLINSLNLRLHAFRDTMKQISHYDSRECILNFIDLCASSYSYTYSSTRINRQLMGLASMEDLNYLQQYFQKWRMRSMEHYEAGLLYASQPDTMAAIQAQIVRKCQPLLKDASYFRRVITPVPVVATAVAAAATLNEENAILSVSGLAARTEEEENEDDEEEQEQEQEQEEGSPAGGEPPPPLQIIMTDIPQLPGVFHTTLDLLLGPLTATDVSGSLPPQAALPNLQHDASSDLALNALMNLLLDMGGDAEVAHLFEQTSQRR